MPILCPGSTEQVAQLVRKTEGNTSCRITSIKNGRSYPAAIDIELALAFGVSTQVLIR